VQPWSKFGKLAAFVAAAVCLIAPGCVVVIATPLLPLYILWLLVPAKAHAFLWVVFGNPPGAVYGPTGSPHATLGAAIRDDLTVPGLILGVEAGLLWLSTLITSHHAEWLDIEKPFIKSNAPYVLYGLLAAYLYVQLIRTKERASMIPSLPLTRKLFVHSKWERVILRSGIFFTALLICVYYVTGDTLGAHILSWSEAERLPDLSVEFRLLPDQPDGETTYACFGFNFDPSKYSGAVAVEARLKDSGPTRQYKLGKMEAQQTDGSPVKGAGIYSVPDDLRQILRRVIFDEEASRKPCIIVVRVAPKDPNKNLLDEAKHDPRKLIAITPMRWSRAPNANQK
jgi:hypothetical protein